MAGRLKTGLLLDEMEYETCRQTTTTTPQPLGAAHYCTVRIEHGTVCACKVVTKCKGIEDETSMFQLLDLMYSGCPDMG